MGGSSSKAEKSSKKSSKHHHKHKGKKYEENSPNGETPAASPIIRVTTEFDEIPGGRHGEAIQPVKVHRGSVNGEKKKDRRKSEKKHDGHHLQVEVEGSSPPSSGAPSPVSGGLLSPNARHSINQGKRGSQSAPSPVVVRPRGSTTSSATEQALQFPQVELSPRTAEWASYLDNYHVQHLLNADLSTIQEIWRHYDLDANRLLTKSEVKVFAKDLVNRILRNYAEQVAREMPGASASSLRGKVQEEKPYILPGKNHKNEEETVKAMSAQIRKMADMNGDGKVSNQEMNVVFTHLMKQFFGDGKPRKQDSGMSCNIQ